MDSPHARHLTSKLVRHLGLGLAAAFIALFGAASAKAADLAALTPAQIERLDDLNLLVQHTDQAQVNGWRRLPQTLDLNGARAVVYERHTAASGLERVIVFLGTKPPDWRHNRLEYLGRWFTGNQENLHSYVQAQAFTKGQMEMAARDGAQVSFAGYSRGSLLSTAMSGVFDRPSVAFNGAPLAKGREYLNPQQFATAKRQSLDLHLDGEPLLALFAVGGQRNLGTTWVVNRSAETHRLIAQAGARGGPAAGWEAAHGLEALRLSLRAPRASFAEVTPVTVEQASALAGKLLLAGQALQRLAEWKGKDLLSEQIGKSFEPLAIGKEVVDMGLALKADIAAAKDHSFVLLKSQTLEAIGSTLLTGTGLPGLDKTKIGQGGLLALANWLHSKGALPAQAGGKITAVPTFGALDLAGAARDWVVDGRVSIDTVQRLTDFAVGASWAGLGLAVSGGNLATAKKFETAGKALASNGRELMAHSGLDKGLLRGLDRGFANQHKAMTAQYTQAVQAAAQRSLPPPTPAEFFGGKHADGSVLAREVLKASGFGQAELARLDRIHDEGAKVATRPPSTQPSEPGGVDMELRVSPRAMQPAAPGSLDAYAAAARRATAAKP